MFTALTWIEGQFTLCLLLLVTAAISYFAVQLYGARMLARSYKERGLPVAPKHSFLFGHLIYLKSCIDALPPYAHYQYALGDIGREHFSKEGCFYLDAWPITGLILVNFSPKIAVQSLQTGTIAVNRPSLLPRFFKPIAGGPNLFDLGEKEWRPWRAIFIKGFSGEQVSSLVPGMIKEVQTYYKTLEKLAEKGEMF
ncbi:hypothetical protein MMC10_002256 [Thelotrema lepadinum]|nr:hypothetical protein [Thelotrema lepadinum]